MEETNRNLFIAEAVKIGNDILSKAILTENGWSWKTISYDRIQKVTWDEKTDLYAGSSGIILFLIELYKYTHDNRYFRAIEEALRWLEYKNANNLIDFAFYTGKMGDAYVMLEMFKLTGNPQYKRKAIDFTKGCENFIINRAKGDDLLNGIAGTVLGLLHLYSWTKEEGLLQSLDYFIGHLINGSHFGKKGLYWDKSAKTIQGLCGLSHGAAGIGSVFLELGKYFKSDAFFWIAEQAFRYENFYYNEHSSNWPDFRKGYFDDESYQKQVEAYLNNDVDFFTKGGNLSTWCHGATGIGFSRLIAHRISHKEEYLKDLLNCLKNSEKNIAYFEDLNSYTLCHGLTGNMLLFATASRQLNDSKYLELAVNIGKKAIKSKEDLGMYRSGFMGSSDYEDLSLFLGNAGIGYAFLKLTDPLLKDSILFPSVEGEDSSSISGLKNICLRIDEVQKQVLNKSFNRTLFLLEKKSNEWDKSMFDLSIPRENLKDEFIKQLEQKKFSEESDLSEIFSLERAAMDMDESIKSRAFLHIKRDLILKKAAEVVSKNNITTLILQLNSDCSLRTFYMHNDGLEKEETNILFTSTPLVINQEHLSDFIYTVVSQFQEKKTVHKAITEIVEKFEFDYPEEKIQIEHKILAQVKEAFLSGILVEAT